MPPNEIAKLIYRAVGWYYSFRDTSTVWLTWDELSDEQRGEWGKLVADKMNGIERGLATAEEMHNDWADGIYETGWKYGDVVSEDAESHPLLVPFSWLTDDQQAIDCMEFTICSGLIDCEVSGPVVASIAYDAAFVEYDLANISGQLPDPWLSTGRAVRDLFLTCGSDAFSGGMVSPVPFHQRWSERMLQDGWNWGPRRDDTQRSEPLILPFNSLPPREQLRFYIACSCINCFATGG